MRQNDPAMLYAGKVIRSEIERIYRGVYRMADAEDISASSIYRVVRGQKPADDPEVVRIERVLGWPRGAVAALAAYRFDELRDMGMDADLVRYAESLAPTPPKPRPTGERRAADRRRAG